MMGCCWIAIRMLPQRKYLKLVCNSPLRALSTPWTRNLLCLNAYVTNCCEWRFPESKCNFFNHGLQFSVNGVVHWRNLENYDELLLYCHPVTWANLERLDTYLQFNYWRRESAWICRDRPRSWCFNPCWRTARASQLASAWQGLLHRWSQSLHCWLTLHQESRGYDQWYIR